MNQEDGTWQIRLIEETGGWTNVWNSDIEGGYPSGDGVEGVINLLPLWVVGDGGDSYLSHAGVDGQTETSPCVNSGRDNPLAIPYYWEIPQRTTRTDRAADTGAVDMGHHYPVTCVGCEIGGECYGDGQANPANECEKCDVSQSQIGWSYQTLGTACGDSADTDCTDPDTCDGAGVCLDNHETDGTGCDDDVFCNGADTCSGGECNNHAGDPCEPVLEVCDEGEDACVAVVLLVDADAACPGGCDGLSWSTAYQDLQDALEAAGTTYPEADEIWVKGNTSTPYTPSEPGGLSSTFTLAQGLALYGGFAGDEYERDQRNPAANETILSGDLNQDDPTVTDNAYHVVTSASGCDETAILDGFTITAGYARGTGLDVGAGMYNDSAGPTVAHCTFRGNTASAGGGGMWNGDGSDTKVTDCVFTENVTGSVAYEPGGAMANYDSDPQVTNCLFVENQACRGGALSNQGGSAPVIVNCTFAEN